MTKPDMRIVNSSDWETQMKLYNQVQQIKTLMRNAEDQLRHAWTNLNSAKKVLSELEPHIYKGEKLC